MLYEEKGSVSRGYPEFSELINVKPGVAYDVKLEVLRSGLAQAGNELKDLNINEESFGRCNPPGSDSDCDFFECRKANDQINTRSISATPGTLSLKLEYSKDPQQVHCKCDRTTWKCTNVNSAVQGSTEMIAAARITLFPKIHRSGEIILTLYNNWIRRLYMIYTQIHN